MSCYGVRYARIDAGGGRLQMFELAVYNSSGGNASQGKSTSASSEFVNDACPYYISGPVDGVLLAKNFYNCVYKGYVSSPSIA